jgi:hypothetical protein
MLKIILWITSNDEEELQQTNKIYKGTLTNFIGVQWKQNPCIENYFGYKLWSATINHIESLVLLQ